MINYYLLTKPGIIVGNLLTMAAGFFLASKGGFDLWLFLAVLVGVACIIASACVFNNYIDREIDRKMKRTKNRALVSGKISHRNALLFGILLAVIGNVVLLLFTNFLTFLVTNLGFGIYVFLYSLWKSRTIYATAIGSIAGAIPPVAGYLAVSNQIDAGAIILFLMLVLWQMPHFFSIAISHINDYKAASLPVLPIVKGLFQTKVHMTLYILGFSLMSAMLTLIGLTGHLYLMIALSVSVIWLLLCLNGFRERNEQVWAKQMFRVSLVTIMAICTMVFLDLQLI